MRGRCSCGGVLKMNDHPSEQVRKRYADAALQVLQQERASCCGSSCKDAISLDLYDSRESAGLPEEALLASLGCGNPTALAELNEGEVVLDLGSGGGIDVLLSAKRVGPSGKAYGLDMTDEMLELARRNAEKAGVGNVEFLKGEIESIPLPDSTVDVIISNCVINLSGDKDAVFAEAFRVLKPGGRLAVADIVANRALPESVLSNIDFWTGCVSGALLDTDYEQKLRHAGFTDVGIQPLRTYSAEDAASFLASDAALDPSVVSSVAVSIYSGFVRARKPAP